MEEEESEQVNYIIYQKVINALEQSRAGKEAEIAAISGWGRESVRL